MRVPTTENCPTCANETPKEHLAKFGRIQSKVYQDLDTGKYFCVKGHEVNLTGQAEEPVREDLAKLEFSSPADKNEKFSVEAPSDKSPVLSGDGWQPVVDSSVAVAEEFPQTNQTQIIPGSMRVRQGGSLEMLLIIPEQFVGPLQSYCDGIGKSVEDYVNEVIDTGFSNGWFL